METGAAGRERLVAALDKVSRTIQDVREGRIPALGEQNTKSALIDPVLAALGWDLTDPAEVFHEYRRQPQDNKVDYALFIEGAPRLFVEAKDLGKDLADRRWVSQVLSYATVVGVEWCVLTNGDEYRVYNAHAPVDAEAKLFRSAHVSEPMELPRTLDLLELLSKAKLPTIRALWIDDFTDRQVAEAVRRLFQSEDPNLVRWLRKMTKELAPSAIRASLRRAQVCVEFPAAPTGGASEPLPPEPPTTTNEESGGPSATGDWGVRAFRPPLRIEAGTDVILLTKWRPLRRETATVRLSMGSVRRTAEAACALAQRGEEVWAPAIQREPGGPKATGPALAGIAALLLAEAVSFARASAHAEYFTVPPGQTPEAMIAKVRQAAQSAEPSRPPAPPPPADEGHRYVVRRRFWTELLARAAKTTKLHAGITPGKDNWLGTGAGRGGLSLCYVVREHDAHVELYIDRGKGSETWNTRVFEQLRTSRGPLEAAFGHPLEWQPLEGKRACRIKYVIQVGGYRDEAKWPEVHEAMVGAMVRLDTALRPYIHKLAV